MEWLQTLQALQMLSSVTLNCHVTKIIMNSGSQLSVLLLVSQMSQHRKGFFGSQLSELLSVSQMSQVSGLSLLLLSIIITIVINVIKILEKS